MTIADPSRRALLAAGLGLAGTGALAACSGSSPRSRAASGAPTTPSGSAPPGIAPSAGRKTVTATLVPRPVTVDLGGLPVQTWAYGDTVPGRLLRATAGDALQVTVDNRLPAETTVHWHGIRLRNAADGVPGVTQEPIAPGSTYVYEFTVPDPGTYFFHPHVGVQLDRGLYAPLIVDDPDEPGKYDAEWVVVLDDWVDGTGTTPDAIFGKLVSGGGASPGPGPGAGADGMGMGMGMGSMGMGMGSMGTAPNASPSMGMHGPGGMGPGHMGGSGSTGGSGGTGRPGGMMMGPAPWGDAGDIAYPHHLVNGRVPADPTVFTGTAGQRVRIRVVNAASDTIYTFALGGHRMTVTHTDGHPVEPAETGAFYIGMGERYDVVVTLGDGAFPLVAVPFGKTGTAFAVVRTAAGPAPSPGTRPRELGGDVLIGSRLRPADSSRLPDTAPESTVALTLNGQMHPYRWGINGAAYGSNTPLMGGAGQRLRIRATNMTMMTHPLHLHGPAFALAGSGLRKDTVLLAPMESRELDLDPDVGRWMAHCHNVYHAEAGMMILLDVAA